MSNGVWEKVPLALISDVTLGKMVKSSASEKENIEQPYLHAANVRNFGVLDIHHSHRTMWFSVNEVSSLEVKAGDVVVVEGGAVGKSAFVKEDLSGYGFQNSILRIRANDSKANGRFIDYSLQSAFNSGEIARLCSSVSLAHFPAEKVNRFRIPFPPLETQQRIADYLDRETAEIDAAVADLDRYMELLEKRKKLQINLAFAPIIETGEIAPLGIFYSIFNGDRGENYPKAEEITDQGIPFLNAGDIRNGSVNLGSAKFVTQDKYNKMGGAKLRSGDILFCLRGSLGKHGIVNFEEGSVASSLCVIRSFNLASHNSQFLNYFMDTTFFSEQILFSENGSAQPNLSGESLARFRIPSISLSRQKSILRDLNRETGEVGSLLAESTQLRELLLKRRSVLIADVVTGRKQV